MEKATRAERANIVNVATLENLNFEMWKYQNKKELEKEIKADIDLSLKALQLMPQFNRVIRQCEIKFGKTMDKFNIMEQEFATMAFQTIYKDDLERMRM